MKTKNINKVYLTLLVLAMVSWSCKRNFNKELVGPEITASANLVEPFRLSTDSANFPQKPVGIYAKFDRKVKWEILIEGTKSFATKTFTGESDVIDSNLVKWDGAQDEYYYFRNNEKCIVTLRVGGANRSYNDPLKIRGEVPATPVLAEKIISIKAKKRTPRGQFELFPKYFMGPPYLPADERGVIPLHNGLVGYDIEPSPMIELDTAFIKRHPTRGFPYFVLNNPNLLEYSKGRQGLKGDRYFILKGKDLTSKITKGKPDFYIGRMATPALRPSLEHNFIYDRTTSIIDSIANKTPDQVYFNVFVYGNGDGSKINYTVKEDENPVPNNKFDEGDDEAYEFSIVVDFKGWRLFSIPYSDFVYAPYKDPRTMQEAHGMYADKIKTTRKIVQVQFGLVAGKVGTPGQMIIDNPVMSWDGPMKY